jgi:hypothetical protein
MRKGVFCALSRSFSEFSQNNQAKGGNYVCSGTQEDRECITLTEIECESGKHRTEKAAKPDTRIQSTNDRTDDSLIFRAKSSGAILLTPFALLRSEFGQ